MSNCIDKQENPNQELDNLKDWKEKQIKFEARRKDTLYGLTGDIDVRTQEDLDLLTESDIKRLIKEGKLKVRQKKRGRKGRFQRAAEHTRLSGVDFIFTPKSLLVWKGEFLNHTIFRFNFFWYTINDFFKFIICC